MIEAILLRLVLFFLMQTLAIITLFSPDAAGRFLDNVEKNFRENINKS